MPKEWNGSNNKGHINRSRENEKILADFQTSDSYGYLKVTDQKDIRGFFYRERKIQKYQGNMRISYINV